MRRLFTKGIPQKHNNFPKLVKTIALTIRSLDPPQIVHPHHLIPPRVDYLDGDALVFSRRKRKRFRPTEPLKLLWLNDTLECPCDFIPGLFVGKERLGDTERPAVVVAVNKPRRHLVSVCGTHRVLYGVIDVHPLHLEM